MLVAIGLWRLRSDLAIAGDVVFRIGGRSCDLSKRAGSRRAVDNGFQKVEV